MRKLFEALTIFDWITPTIGIAEDIYNDPDPLQRNSHTFFVPYDESINSGWNAFDIDKLMRENGIKPWGGQITNGQYFFTVPKDKAKKAEQLLNDNGVPLK